MARLQRLWFAKCKSAKISPTPLAYAVIVLLSWFGLILLAFCAFGQRLCFVAFCRVMVWFWDLFARFVFVLVWHGFVVVV